MDRQLMLSKVEATYGTDSEPAAVNTVLAEAVRFSMSAERVTGDPARPGVARVAGHTHGEHAELQFEVPLAASGEAGVAPGWGSLLAACGWEQTIVAETSVTYARLFEPAGAPSNTLIWRDARRFHKITGARGRAGIRIQAGQRPMLVFNFKGLHSDVAPGAALAAADANFTNWRDSRPVAQGRTQFAFDGEDMPLREFNLDAADNVRFVDLPHQENVQLLGPMGWSGKVKASTPPVGTVNFESLWKSGALQVMAFTHESAEGETVTVNARAQVSGAPDYSRDGDEDVVDVPLEFLPQGLTAKDELSIVLT